jgi:two-component system KDP operon response regulator KdpE
MASKILIVDDEPNIIGTVAPLLRARGYDVCEAMTGHAALAAVDREQPDLVVLDLGLPDIDGVEVCRRIRESGSVPIVVLSRVLNTTRCARSIWAPTITSRPFGAENSGAPRVALRQVDSPPRPSGPTCAAARIDRERFRVMRDGEEVRLTPKEFELLTFLAQHPGRVLTHRAIMKAIWGPHVDQPEHLRVLVAALRKKLEPTPSAPRYILTEPWVGYRFAES